MRARPVSELLALPVRIHGIHVGRGLAFYCSHARRLDSCGYANPHVDERGGIHETLNAV
ncbi:MAG TPA: hypothetical protein VGQ38_04010 [Gaiellaceae bacterium]|nr:hypothetical protein [Gaiellaceae bacterium]